MRTVLLIVALVLGQIPTPTKLVDGRRVFLSSDGVDRATLQELGQQIAEWGRWTLQADEASSDLVVILTRTPEPRPDLTSGPDARGWVLTVREPATTMSGVPTPLYSDVEPGVYAAGAVSRLMARLKATVEGRPSIDPRTAASPATATAGGETPRSRSTEPCRVFVTEQPVNPSFYTAIKRIKYRKKYYGGSSHAWEGMAREGRKVGADAVVAVNINFRPSMFSWASPHAEGIAVTWNEDGRRHFPSLAGQCFEEPAGGEGK